MDSRVVVLLADGTRIEGFSRVVNAIDVTFHLKLAGPDGETGEKLEVRLNETLAVFFVRDFAFGRERRYEPEDDLSPMPRPASAGGRAARVNTVWGEVLVGL